MVHVNSGAVIVSGTLFFGVADNWLRGRDAFSMFDGDLAAFVDNSTLMRECKSVYADCAGTAVAQTNSNTTKTEEATPPSQNVEEAEENP